MDDINLKPIADNLPPDLVNFESNDRRVNFSADSLKDSPCQGNLNDSGNDSGVDGTSAVLAASLQALATHCAHLQFRLQQVLAAPAPHRDKLLSELADFASKPIDCPNGITSEPVAPLIEGLDNPTSPKTPTSPTTVVPTKVFEQLKTQVTDLERYITYIQKVDNSDNPSTSTPSFKKFTEQTQLASAKPQLKGSFNFDVVDSDQSDDNESLPFHRRLWQSFACGRSKQRVNTTGSDSDDDGSQLLRPMRNRTGSDSCNEDTDNVILLVDTTVRAFALAEDGEYETRLEALGYSLAVALTHGMRKDRLAKLQKSLTGQQSNWKNGAIPVSACSWNFLQFIHDSQGGLPSTEANAARLRATFDVPEPSRSKNSSSYSPTDLIGLLIGAIGRIDVEEEPSSPHGKAFPTTQLDFVTISMKSWSRFIRLGLEKPSDKNLQISGYPLVLWMSAIAACRRLLRSTHFSWAPIRACPERIIESLALLDESLIKAPPVTPLSTRRSSERPRIKKRLSSGAGSNLRSQWVNEDVIIPSV